MAKRFDNSKKGNSFKGSASKNGRSQKSFSKGGKGREKYQKKDEGATFEGTNDPRWYVYNDQIVADAGSVSYNNRVGQPMKDPTMFPWGQVQTRLPSLMAFHWTPVLGPFNSADDSAAPINIQARAMFSKLQSSVSTSLPFTAADIAIHWGAIDSIFIWYKHCQRLYRVWQNYQVMNTMVPNIYFKAAGLDYNTMEQYEDETQESGYGSYTMVDFRAELNRIAVDLTRLFVPKDLKIFERHAHMSDYIYADSTTEKHQEYMFIPSGVWKFDATGSSTGGRLVWRTIFGKGHVTDAFATTGLKGVMDIMRELMSTFYNDSDVWTIDGFMRRGYKDYDTYKISMLTEFERVDPIFDAEMLLQIHHIDAVGFLQDESGYIPTYAQTASNNVTIDHNGSYQLVTEASRNGHTHGPEFILDMPVDSPTALDNLVATRLMPKTDMKIWDGTTTGRTALVSYGSEIVNNILVMSTFNSDYYTFATTNVPMGVSSASTSALDFDDILAQAKIAKFAFHPMWKITNDKASGSASDYQYTTWVDVLSDTNNATTINWRALMKMHDAAVMGEWFIPKDIPLDSVVR